MVTKEQAHAAKTKLQSAYPGVSFGLSKDGQDYVVAARSSDYEALAAVPAIVDGVKVQTEATGNIKAL